MSRMCKTPKELGEAIKEKEEFIYIEGDLKNQVIRIKATGKVAWGVCAVALGMAITFYVATPAATVAATPVGGGMAAVSAFTATTVAATTLGSAAVVAVIIGIAAGGIGALEALRDRYKIVEKDDKHIKLQRK
ncbi:MAG: hypothetical protein K2O06_15485 [Acetatifactor sp.]|nr:hypothetical protein [Acetatifactor sp.]